MEQNSLAFDESSLGEHALPHAPRIARRSDATL
jgi:hypothetical protein